MHVDCCSCNRIDCEDENRKENHLILTCNNNIGSNDRDNFGSSLISPATQNEEIPVQIRSTTEGEIMSNTNGRCLVASKNFDKGDLIFREHALISGPSSCSSLNEDGLPVCLSCYSLVQTRYRCRRCGFPVCNYTCEQDGKHAFFECPIFASNGVSTDQILDPETITILRCLLLRDKDTKNWFKLLELQQEAEESHHQSSSNAMALLCDALTFIHQTCDLDQFDFDTVENITRIIDVNGFGSEDRQRALLYRYGTYVFERGSLLAHSCIPNAYRVINPNSQLEVYAAVPIKAGEVIKTVYTETFLGTVERRKFLHDFFYLSCSCSRCSSATECDTFFQAIKCQNDENCQKSTEAVYLPIQPLDPNSEWKCTLCKDVKGYDFISAMEEAVRSDLSQIDGDRSMDRVLKLEAVAGKHRGVSLHPNHFLILRTEYDIVQRMSFILYRNRLIRMQVEFVLRYIELIRKILQVLNIILPGFNRHRGRVLYFLQQGLMYLIQYKTNPNNKKRVDSKSLSTLTEEYEEFLSVSEEGKWILMVEPEGSEERLLANEMATDHNGEIEILKKTMARDDR
ncbi:Protein msta, isoform B [Orchesella cincta]|uniref:Protein msta, isoform B n=1 Tax=Orchesella cincta TaxID=48709 RepID=A0A1D2NBD3_ORCCI|nr:Protein msta, isoform B [Orchesella cincta]